ncbi:UDP diphospho-muramoyl pentapeptide beta-N acetylglucosaminyl transferase [Synergistales bacterium]|nr:UDP diphospho-muramoyl pentapeptide beta-N acetylglucosaminyl transferase [Synergistales bacterium]
MNDPVKKVLIAAGGTGGHIFPALAFGEWIQEEKKARSVVYISGSRALELEIYNSRGVKPICLSLGGSPLGASSGVLKLRRCFELFSAFLRVGTLFFREKPDACFLFGSYVSLPFLFWSFILRVPVALHEQNSCAGKVTRLASFLGVPIASGWEECRGLSKPFTPVGVPIRRLEKISKPDAASILGLDIGRADFVVGVIGGSIGSASIQNITRQIAQNKKNFVFAALGNQPSSEGVSENIRFLGKHWDMTPFYSVVDAVICRAGASTLAELMAYDIPALVVPWMSSADGHQELNAQNFSRLTGNPIWIQKETDTDYLDLDNAFERLIEISNNKRDKNQNRKADNSAFDKSEQSKSLWRILC